MYIYMRIWEIVNKWPGSMTECTPHSREDSRLRQKHFISKISAFEIQRGRVWSPFGVSFDVRIYNQNESGCSTVLKPGSTQTLKVLKSQHDLASGVVRFISYKSCPMKFYCQEHSLINGSPNVWLPVKVKYIRCVVPWPPLKSLCR